MLNKIDVKVPAEVLYISEWKEYNIPLGKFIIDKGVTGCGFTEYCLTNNDNIILCSPRKLLLRNKVEQHLQDDNILYLENTLEIITEYDSSEKDKINRSVSLKDSTQVVNSFRDKIRDHIFHCSTVKKPVKILTTYDSFKYVYQFLGLEHLEGFKVIVDEFQSIFMDSSFKADTELVFSQYIDTCPNVCYLSATPMLEEYLEKIPEFQDLDMYVFKWKNYIEKAMVTRKKVSSIYIAIKDVIKDYKLGKYPKLVLPNKAIKESHEAVFYFNSVRDIIKIIKDCGLTPQDTDVICADTDKNRRKLKKLGFMISKPNTKDNRYLNKMFTFCTRTVYLGADFYSDNATTWVASNPNVNHLAVDIALDLPQILGRQRMSENPWKNYCTLFYQLTKDISSQEDIDKIIDKKLRETYNLLTIYSETPEDKKDTLKNVYRRAVNYESDYLGISSKNDTPAFNVYVWVSETRFWKITQQDYIDNISVRRAIENQDFEDRYESLKKNPEIKRVSEIINGPGEFPVKMESYCEFCDTHSQDEMNFLDYSINTKKYNNYYTLFGTDRIKTFSYREKALKLELESNFVIQDGSMRAEIYKTFQVNQQYTLKYIKQKLKDIYSAFLVSLTPKASVLTDYFNIKTVKILNPDTRKWENGFKILSVK